jgi:signal peptidase I
VERQSAPSPPEGASITLEADAGAPPVSESAGDGRRLLRRQFPLVVVGAVVIALLVKSFLLQAFYIPSTSMLPTLERGDRVLVEKVGRHFGGPARGDVVVFERDTAAGPPSDTGSPLSELTEAFKGLLGLSADGTEDLIKRVIAVEDDVVEGRGTQVWVNGEPLEEDYVFDGDAAYNFEPTTVEPGMIFVMGDNRDGSQDSRSFGPVPVDRVVGKAIFVIWPLNRAGPI